MKEAKVEAMAEQTAPMAAAAWVARGWEAAPLVLETVVATGVAEGRGAAVRAA